MNQPLRYMTNQAFGIYNRLVKDPAQGQALLEELRSIPFFSEGYAPASTLTSTFTNLLLNLEDAELFDRYVDLGFLGNPSTTRTSGLRDSHFCNLTKATSASFARHILATIEEVIANPQAEDKFFFLGFTHRHNVLHAFAVAGWKPSLPADYSMSLLQDLNHTYLAAQQHCNKEEKISQIAKLLCTPTGQVLEAA